MDVPSTIMREMESFHASIAKALQGLPENACNIGAIRTLGWTSIQSNIDINRLLFLWRIICLPVTCIYKRLLITRYGYICYDMYDCKGPLKCMLDTAKKYNLFNHVREAIESGQHITMNAWKRLVKETVRQKEECKWRVNASLYSSLRRLRQSMPSLSISAWWSLCQNNPCIVDKCKTAIKLLLECHQLNVRVCKYPNSLVKSSLCTSCNMFINDTIEHMLFECSSLYDIRKRLWNNIIDECPSEIFIRQMEQMDSDKRATYLVSCLHNSYIVEWNHLFNAIVTYIHVLYRKKLALTN